MTGTIVSSAPKRAGFAPPNAGALARQPEPLTGIMAAVASAR
jgi:hypothetical protein